VCIWRSQDREEAFRNTSESTNARVMWWSILQTIVLLVSGVWQINRLKKFFRGLSLTPAAAAAPCSYSFFPVAWPHGCLPLVVRRQENCISRATWDTSRACYSIYYLNATSSFASCFLPPSLFFIQLMMSFGLQTFFPLASLAKIAAQKRRGAKTRLQESGVRVLPPAHSLQRIFGWGRDTSQAVVSGELQRSGVRAFECSSI
jgi:hypothetical protein